MLKLLSSMAPREVIADAIARYKESVLIDITALAAGGVDVAKRVAAGEIVDIVVLAKEAIAKLIGEGHLSADGCTDLMSSGIAVAVRSGSDRPAISDETALKNAVLSSTSLSYSTGPSGLYLEKLFERWGILAAIRERIVVPPPGAAVAQLIESGQVELGFQQLSELINVPGIEIVCELPAAVQLRTTFTAAVSKRCKGQASARDFVIFLASPEVDSIRARHGMSALR